MGWIQILDNILKDPRYKEGVEWGKPRSGHPEGTIKRHIEELVQNLKFFQNTKLVESWDEYYQLQILIHVHDTFKYASRPKVSISDPESHGSLARKFLSEFTDDSDMLYIVQYHDEWYSIARKGWRGKYNEERLKILIQNIRNWNLYLKFVAIDNGTKGKSDVPLSWFIEVADGYKPSKWILPHIRKLQGSVALR